MSKRMLIVEDSKPIALVIERMATSLGYKVTIAPSFAVVKKLMAQDHQFFVATVDYGLPDAPNGEVIPYLIEHKVPSIIMTGRMDDATHKRILNYPIIDYITKENAQAYHYLLRILNGQLTNRKIGVLVVDDSLTARNQVSQLLKRRNFSVFGADSGPKALQALEQFPNIKIVLTDQEMPGMDGIELVQKMRKLHGKSELVIIGLSGSNRSFQSARFIKNGADDFLKKPFCPEEFYCRIMQHIEKLDYITEIETAANTDYLTGLCNRRYFFEQTKKRQQDIEASKHVLVKVYIDGFKEINDKHGHEIGDHVLIELSTLLAEHLPKALLARFGGAEFGVFLSENDLKNVENDLDNLRIAVSLHEFKHNKVSINLSVSVGATVVDNEQPFNEALKLSDQALHKAIDNGGNQLELNGF